MDPAGKSGAPRASLFELHATDSQPLKSLDGRPARNRKARFPHSAGFDTCSQAGALTGRAKESMIFAQVGFPAKAHLTSLLT